MVIRSPRTRIGLAAVAAIIVTLFVILPGPQMSRLSAEEVLDRTAKALRSVKAYHYEMRTPGVPSALVREMWAQGDRIYARGLREGEPVAEFWADPTRIVRYDRETSKVTISDANPGLLHAMGGIALVRNFKPEDWQPLPGFSNCPGPGPLEAWGGQARPKCGCGLTRRTTSRPG